MISNFNAFASGNVQRFRAKKMDRIWLWASVTLAPKAVDSCSKAQKTFRFGKSSSLH